MSCRYERERVRGQSLPTSTLTQLCIARPADSSEGHCQVTSCRGAGVTLEIGGGWGEGLTATLVRICPTHAAVLVREIQKVLA